MKLRRLKRLAPLGAAAVSMALLIGTGPAQANTLGQPPQYPTAGMNQFRAAGSETTYYVMNAVGNLFSQTSVYGCTLNTLDNRTCNNTAGDGSATDSFDDYSRNEFVNGAGIGSGAGVKQLCAASNTGGLVTDFARMSRAPKSSECGGKAIGLQFAWDSIPALVFPFHNTAAITCTGTCSATQIGPVAAGWRPGDAVGGPYSGVAFNNISNTSSAVLGNNSLAFEIYCDKSTSSRSVSDAVFTSGSVTMTSATANFASTDVGSTIITSTANVAAGTFIKKVNSATSVDLSNKAAQSSSGQNVTIGTGFGINDWGQLTDPTPDAAHGNVAKGLEGIGAPIGVPIYIPAVNTGSGTYSVWSSYVGCDPNAKNADGQTAQENDAPQLTDIANRDFPSDNIAANNQIAASLYYVSYGVSQWHPYTTTTSNISGQETKVNGVFPSTAKELQGTSGIATARQLVNAYVPTLMRGSVAGFLNWLCDTDPAGQSSPLGGPASSGATHGTDLTTGKNYSAELTNTISTQFVFPRVPCGRTDGSGGQGTATVTSGSTTVADNLAQGPASARIVSDGATTNGSSTLTAVSGRFGPTDVGAAVTGAGIPASTIIATVVNSATVTLSNPATASGLNVPVTISPVVSPDLNQPISGTGIPAGTTITAVTPGTGYTISNAATLNGTSVILTGATPLVSNLISRVDGTGGLGTVVVTSGSSTVSDTQIGFQDNQCADCGSGAVGDFEVGEGVSGAGIPAGTTITAVTPGQSFTMSNPATASGTSVTIADINV